MTAPLKFTSTDHGNQAKPYSRESTHRFGKRGGVTEKGEFGDSQGQLRKKAQWGGRKEKGKEIELSTTEQQKEF